MEFRTGLGWDVHRTGPGDEIILGGVNIPAEFSLVGHSDADALLHAVTDAVLGAAGLGDIGMHFPDTDPMWKGQASDVFLLHAVKMVRAKAYRLVNVDTTVILQRPKLKDHRQVIRESVATTCGLGQSVSMSFRRTT